MFKIKLLILFLISSLFFSCSENKNYHTTQKYALGYIGGEFEGVILKNYLKSYLNNLSIYDENSNFKIETSIKHSSNRYITNIDNTSDREKINTKLKVNIINTMEECNIYSDEIEVSQFYIYASNDKLLSNQNAVSKIKRENTYSIVRKFINKLKFIEYECLKNEEPDLNN